uniref:Uncharacterized protein n=1 Tax=Arundo donax TaxID=35708 RepID=A0A0A9GMV7_ARUDO
MQFCMDIMGGEKIRAVGIFVERKGLLERLIFTMISLKLVKFMQLWGKFLCSKRTPKLGRQFGKHKERKSNGEHLPYHF